MHRAEALLWCRQLRWLAVWGPQPEKRGWGRAVHTTRDLPGHCIPRGNVGGKPGLGWEEEGYWQEMISPFHPQKGCRKSG